MSRRKETSRRAREATAERTRERPRTRWWQRWWSQYVDSFDEHQLRRISHPRAMLACAAAVVTAVLALGLYPPLQRATGTRHPWLVVALVIAGFATTAAHHKAHGKLFWALNLVDSWLYVTAAVTFALCSSGAATYTGVLIYAMAMIGMGSGGGFSWVYLSVLVVWPFVLSFLAPLEMGMPLLCAAAAPVYFLVSSGAGRQRVLLAQRDAARNAQLLQANRLAALGRLSAGLAHELNQHLFSVRGFAQRLRRDSELGSEGRTDDDLRLIEEATERMSRIIDNVRRLSRPERAGRDLVDPGDPLRVALSLIARQLQGHGIGVQWHGQVGPSALVRSDPIELEQVFLNLLLNARDALCSLDPKQPRRLQLGIHVQPELVVLSVEDNGPGVRDEHQARLFEPGFSTKAATDGCGIGLWISRSFVAAAGGKLRFESVPDGGARFLVELPKAAQGSRAEHDAGLD